MITVLAIIIFFQIATLILRFQSRRSGSNNFKSFALVVSLISIIYFYLITGERIGSESTPIWVTTTNALNKNIQVYYITVYDDPVFEGKSRFVYGGNSIYRGEKFAAILEIDGAVEFWIVGIDDLDKIIFFEISHYSGSSDFQFVVDQASTMDNVKSQLAFADIKTYISENRKIDTFIYIGFILSLILLFEVIFFGKYRLMKEAGNY